jgi:hypothetical protein
MPTTVERSRRVAAQFSVPNTPVDALLIGCASAINLNEGAADRAFDSRNLFGPIRHPGILRRCADTRHAHETPHCYAGHARLAKPRCRGIRQFK